MRISFCLLFLWLALATSCKKESKETLLRVMVLDSADNGVSKVNVKLTIANPPADLNENVEQIKDTDVGGMALFSFNDIYIQGQGGLMVLDVYLDGKIAGIAEIKPNEINVVIFNI